MADIDWSQFSTEPPPAAAPDSGGIDWSQFTPAPPGEEGPPRADFGNVEAGAQQNTRPSVGTLGRWFSGVPSAADARANEEKAAEYGPDFLANVGSAVQGAREDYQYPQEYDEQGRPKRRISGSEGLVRGLAADLGEFGAMGEAATPIGFAKRIAGAITGHADPGNEMAEAARLHPETEQYTGARAELVGELGHNIISNLLPLESAAAGVGKFFMGAERRAAQAMHDAALIGKLGPEAQGAATANEITAQAVERRPPKPAGELDITPEMRVPAEEAPLGPVSAAPLDQSAVPGAREAFDLSAGRAPEPMPQGAAATAGAERPPGGPDLGVAPPQPAAEPLYHASLSPDIEQFDVARAGSQSDSGVLGRAALYATGDERLAPFYLGPQKDAGTLYQVEHSLQNPKEFASPQEAIAWQGERGTDSPEAAERVRQKYLDAGHDGAIVRNPQTGKIMEAAIFDPNAARITNRRPIKPPEPDSVDLAREFTPRMAEEIGWEERGGRIIRGDGGEHGFGDVTGRTPWVPKQAIDRSGPSQFWSVYRSEEGSRALTEAQAQVALAKANAGKELTVRERRFVDRAKAAAAQYGEDYYFERLGAQHESMQAARSANPDEFAAAQALPEGERMPRGGSNAEDVRVDQGPTGVPERAGSPGEVRGGGDLQRPREEGGNADVEPLRAAGAAPERYVEPISTGELTGISHARVAEERSAKGLDELHYELKRRFPEVHAKARAVLEKDPNAGRALVQSVLDKPRPLSAEENVTLALDRARVKNETDRAYADAADAMDRGDVNAEAEARARLKMADEEMKAHDQAAKAGGYESGIGLASRDILVKRDYSLAEVRQRARVAAGTKELKPKEEKMFVSLAQQIAEKDKQIAELQRGRLPRENVPRGTLRKADTEFRDLSAQVKALAKHIVCGV